MKHLLSLGTILALMLVLLSACTPAAPKLDGTDWKIIEMNGSAVPENITITLKFKDGNAGGTAACNSYGANYKQDGSQLTFEPPASTMMYCEGMMNYESDFFTALGSIRSFKLDTDRLSLLDDSGVVRLLFGKL